MTDFCTKIVLAGKALAASSKADERVRSPLLRHLTCRAACAFVGPASPSSGGEEDNAQSSCALGACANGIRASDVVMPACSRNQNPLPQRCPILTTTRTPSRSSMSLGRHRGLFNNYPQSRGRHRIARIDEGAHAWQRPLCTLLVKRGWLGKRKGHDEECGRYSCRWSHRRVCRGTMLLVRITGRQE